MSGERHLEDPVEVDIESFAHYDGEHGGEMGGCSEPEPEPEHMLEVTLTLELPGGWGTSTFLLLAIVELIDRLERDGLRPSRSAVEILERPTA